MIDKRWISLHQKSFLAFFSAHLYIAVIEKYFFVLTIVVFVYIRTDNILLTRCACRLHRRISALTYLFSLCVYVHWKKWICTSSLDVFDPYIRISISAAIYLFDDISRVQSRRNKKRIAGRAFLCLAICHQRLCWASVF